MKKLIILSSIAITFAYAGTNNYEVMKKMNHYGVLGKDIQECKYPNVYKDSLGFVVSIKEHYGGTEKDSGTILMQNDIEYCLVKRNQPARIIPKSRWTVTIDEVIK